MMRSSNRQRSGRTADPVVTTDEGSAMIMMLVMIIICSLVVIPVLRYATAVTRSARVQQSKSMRIEAVKGGLRTALADPISLYKSCDAAGLTVSVALAEPLLTTKVASKCYKMNDVTASDPLNLRYAVATTQVGAAVPTDSAGTAFPGSGAAPASAWQASAFVTPKLNTVWAPDLPAHGLNQRSNSGYAMPTGFATCSVYFPGTYKDPLTITGSTPVFFTSGIYYFENTVRISGNANVVVGDGGTQGCSNDQEAAFYATNAPSTHNISGLGATFVFGSTGRLVIDNVTAGNTSIVFNQRYVAATDASTLSSAGVSIESVNGVISGGDQSDLTLAGFLSVPQSRVGGATITTAVSQSYVPSTLVPTAPIAPAVVPTNPLPIIDINLSTAATVNVIIPGYVSVPQGLVNVNVASVAAAANKTIQLAGGVLAASYTVTDQRPASFVLGLLNPIIQKIFKIVTITDTSIGAPVITSTAIVQVNQNGAYAVNSWAVQ